MTPAEHRHKNSTAPTTSSRVRIWLVAGGVLVALLLVEATLRLTVSDPPKQRLTEPRDISPFQQTPKGLYIYQPGVTFAHIYDPAADTRGYYGPDGRVEYRINNLGLRGEDIRVEKEPGVQRVLCLGDSFTFGEGVREEDTWPSRLEQLLGPGHEAINAGVQGYDLDHEGLYLFLYGRQLQPDVVVIGFFMNDALPFGETVAHHALMADTPAGDSWLSRTSVLWRTWTQRRIASRRTKLYLRQLQDSFSSRHWLESKARIGRFREMGDHDGFETVALVFPVLYGLDGDYFLEEAHQVVRAAFEEAGIPVLDLLDDYRGHATSQLWAHPVDPHPSALAQQLAAERVYGWLTRTNS